MAYTILENDTTITAAKLDNNFLEIGQGNLIPKANSTLDGVDSTYDIGSTTKKWAEIHTQSVEVKSDEKVTPCINLIAEYTFDDTGTTLEFAGLDGDDDAIYMLKIKIKGKDTGTTIMRFNTDDAANYGYNKTVADTTVTYSVAQNNTSIEIGSYGYHQTYAMNLTVEMKIFAALPQLRMCMMDKIENAGHTYISGTIKEGAVWNNITDTLTSIQFTGHFGTNTNFQLWAMR